jgi:hypothetical protein
MADAVETVTAPNVLWLADGDTGYGNAFAVQKTIRTYARRGAANRPRGAARTVHRLLQGDFAIETIHCRSRD